jgi:colanic acid/amylovoran biosynthesis glycosyltransferase
MSRPLRIAFFLGSFPVISETFILRQITGLRDLGHDVRIFANARPDASAPIHPEVADYKLMDRTTYVNGPAESVIWELPLWPLSGKTWLPGATESIANWRRCAAALPTAARCLFQAPRLTRQLLSPDEYRYQAASWSGVYRLATLCQAGGGFDVLHAHFGPVGNSFRFARALWQAPLVVSFHGYDFSTSPRKEGRSMYERLFETADVITVNSEFTRSQVEKLGCPGGKLRKLPVGLDLKAFPFRERTLQSGEPLRLLTVARLTEIKGHEHTLRALGLLRRAVPSLQYDIVGDGPLRGRLESLVAELGLSDVVIFHGAAAADAIKSLLAQTHLFLFCSVSVEGDQEGQGLALQEAQACGVPVVATAHGALPEGLREGYSGFLVPERDPVALADRLKHLTEHAAEWPAHGRAGRAFVEGHYEIWKLNAQLVDIYSEAIQGLAA